MTRRQVAAMSFSALFAAACATGTPMPPAAEVTPGTETGGFVTTLGSDTIAVERFTLSANMLDAEAVTRSPRTSIRKIHMEWSDDGRLSTFTSSDRAPGAPPEAASASMELTVSGDSATWNGREGDRSRTWTIPANTPRGVFTPPLYSPYAMLVRIALAKGDSVARILTPMGRFKFTVTRPAAEWVALSDPDFGTLRLRLDARGRVQEIDATGTTVGDRVKRVTPMDIAGRAREFAQRDTTGRALGLLSPPDTLRATFGAASASIVYGRPHVRGRLIFGGVVPWNRVWRTGANAATMFTTDRDLMIGDTRVPAGSYTLWTIPAPDSWQLVINKQTGQWGTEYSAEQDLARIPMNVRTLPNPVEQFTIEAGDASGRLTLMWDRTRVWVPVRAADTPQP